MVERARAGLGQLVAATPAVVPGLLGIGLLLWWAADDGGFDPLSYLPGTIFVVALVALVAIGIRDGIPGGRLGVAALAALAAYVAWCYLSILWAGVRADALDGANKTFAYAAVYALFALRPWTARAAAIALGVYGVGVAAIGLRGLVAISSTDPGAAFREGRFAEPISYPNGNVALFAAAAFPLVHLASRREVHPFLRGLVLASAGVLVEMAVLVQSRAYAVVGPLVLLVYVLLTSQRTRAAGAAVLCIVPCLVSLPWLLPVYGAVTEGKDVADTLVTARSAVLFSGALLLAAGAVWGVIDRQVEIAPRVTRSIGVALAAAAVLVVLVGAGAAATRIDDPAGRVSSAWTDFRESTVGDDDGAAGRYTSGFGGDGRYEIWRVAWVVFGREPVLGAGVDNFEREYLAERRNRQSPLYPHSVELRVLQQTGIVGGLLVLLFVGAAVVLVARSLRGQGSFGRGLAAAATAMWLYWTAHGTIDWFWEIPALSAAALAALGLVVATGPGRTRPMSRRSGLVLTGALAAVTVVALLPPWASARQVEQALAIWRADPSAAYSRLDRAARLQPLGASPHVLTAVIAAQLGDVPRQRAALEKAISIDGRDWYTRMELGLLDARAGDTAAAKRWLASAVALNPGDVTLQWVVKRVGQGRTPSQRQVDDELAYRAERLTGERQG